MPSLNKYNYEKVSQESIASVENLAIALGLSYDQLERAITLDEDVKYKKVPVDKSDGGIRLALNPHKYIRQVQRKINSRILSDLDTIEWPDYIFGSIPNTNVGLDDEVRRDYISCAKVHCGKKSLLKVDIKEFYDNVHEEVVYDVFNKFLCYPESVSNALTELCTFRGVLPQGALTSGYLACLCLYDLEPKLVRRLERKGLSYTRYIDDITVSSNRIDQNFEYSLSIISSMLADKDLPLNNKKTEILRASSTPLMVHGLRVGFEQPRLPSKEVRNIRAAVQSIEKVAKIPGYRTTRVYRRSFSKCLGRVNKLKRVGHNKHAVLLKRLKVVRPLAHEDDVERVKSMIRRLRHDYESKRATYLYHRRYHRAHQRLNIIKINFRNVATQLRTQLRSLKSEYTH
ncbi:reverse transcriptase family protein [Vreelandella sp. EE27]